MTFDDRIEVQERLRHGMTFLAIEEHLEKDPTTVSKEIKRHIKVHTNSLAQREDLGPRLLKAPSCATGAKTKAVATGIRGICIKP